MWYEAPYHLFGLVEPKPPAPRAPHLRADNACPVPFRDNGKSPWQAREANAAEVPEGRSAGSLCKAGTDYPLGMGASRRSSHRARHRATIGPRGVKHLLPQIAPEPSTASFLPRLRSFWSTLPPAFV